jgi:hypothetical protein
MKQLMLLLALIVLVSNVGAVISVKSIDFTITTATVDQYFVGNASANQTATLPIATGTLAAFPRDFTLKTDPGSYYFKIDAGSGKYIKYNTSVGRYLMSTDVGSNIKLIGDKTYYYASNLVGVWYITNSTDPGTKLI